MASNSQVPDSNTGLAVETFLSIEDPHEYHFHGSLIECMVKDPSCIPFSLIHHQHNNLSWISKHRLNVEYRRGGFALIFLAEYARILLIDSATQGGMAAAEEKIIKDKNKYINKCVGGNCNYDEILNINKIMKYTHTKTHTNIKILKFSRSTD